jgi:hypothetical protein
LLDGVGLQARLMPHYFMSVFALIVHAGCGLRIVALKHGYAQGAVDRMFYIVATIGFLAAVTVSLALAGVHLR